MNDLGWLYQNGLGITQDYAKARGWFEKAAAEGTSAAMSNLGSLYQNGWGVPQDFSKAREWFEKGAVAGNGAAMSNFRNEFSARLRPLLELTLELGGLGQES